MGAEEVNNERILRSESAHKFVLEAIDGQIKEHKESIQTIEDELKQLESELEWIKGAAERAKREEELAQKRAKQAAEAATSSRGGCFNPEAVVQMYNGSPKMAKDVQVGDKVKTSDGGCAEVEAHTIQGAGISKDLVQIGDLLIPLPHRVQCDGVWMEPINYPSAKRTVSACELHNFVVTGRKAILVEGIIASTIGQHCPGSHDFQWPTHRLWGSEHIVDLFKTHPLWPNIRLPSSGGSFLKRLKSSKFALKYLADHARSSGLVDRPVTTTPRADNIGRKTSNSTGKASGTGDALAPSPP